MNFLGRGKNPLPAKFITLQFASPSNAVLKNCKVDLRASENLVSDELVWDVAIYHTQQCAEKSLKAYLAWSKYPLEKTHNLVKLLELCMIIDNEFVELRDEAEVLTVL